MQRMNLQDILSDSTQRGCTSWLLISCAILTLTTAFVFGWGLGAPNMYNHYTELFLKDENPCKTEYEATTLWKQSANVMHLVNIDSEVNDIINKNNIGNNKNTNPNNRFFDGTDQQQQEVNRGTSKTVEANMTKKRFDFVGELIKDETCLGGMACVIVPPYIGEIASRRVRGAAGAAFRLSLTVGILIAQLTGMPFIAGTCRSWSWGLASVFLLPFIGLFILFLIPNSPTQMIALYNNDDQATDDLRKLRGTSNVQTDVDLIHQQIRQLTNGSKSKPLSIPNVN
ncbi:unnamed protein product [Rotaria sp. Silwood2]|nr:unnamed protein product [Rotaria sp. Silwood2]